MVSPACDGALVGGDDGCWVGWRVEGAREGDAEGVAVGLRLGEEEGLRKGEA